MGLTRGQIKMLAGLYSFLEALGKISSCLLQLLEDCFIPQLEACFLSRQSQQWPVESLSPQSDTLIPSVNLSLSCHVT